jgi:hypothetical protein
MLELWRGDEMGQHETVRASALPSQLTLQLMLGNAIEIAYLIDANVMVQEEDLAILRRTASALDAGGVAPEQVNHAVQRASLDLFAAAEVALTPSDQESLRVQLHRLAESLRALADGQEPELGLHEVIEKLTALREVLSSTSVVRPDEIRGLLPTG